MRRTAQIWSRILISNEQPVVSVSEFRPATGEYVLTRYQLDNATMDRIRAARRANEPRPAAPTPRRARSSPTSSATSPPMLPQLPNERLVYACEHQDGPAR